MTLAPGRLLGPRLTLVRDEDVTVHEPLEARCYCPGCGSPPEPGAHHIEPRSRTGGPRSFVLIDGIVVSNLCRLCSYHHAEITGGIGGHKARIVWHEKPLGHWCWLALYKGGDVCSTTWLCRGPLRFPHTPEVCDARFAC